MKKIILLLSICLIYSCTKNDLPLEEKKEFIVDKKLVGKWTISYSAYGFAQTSVYKEGDILWEFTDKGEMIVNNSIFDNSTRASGTYKYFVNQKKDTLTSIRPSGKKDYPAKYSFKNNDSILTVDYGFDHDSVKYILAKYK